MYRTRPGPPAVYALGCLRPGLSTLQVIYALSHLRLKPFTNTLLAVYAHGCLRSRPSSPSTPRAVYALGRLLPWPSTPWAVYAVGCPRSSLRCANGVLRPGMSTPFAAYALVRLHPGRTLLIVTQRIVTTPNALRMFALNITLKLSVALTYLLTGLPIIGSMMVNPCVVKPAKYIFFKACCTYWECGCKNLLQ